MFLKNRYIYILLCLLLLTACTSKNEKSPTSLKNDQTVVTKVVPIDRKVYDFIEVLGFLKKDWVLMNRQKADQIELVAKHLLTGEEKEIYHSYQPIIMASANADGTQVAIQESQDDTSTVVRVVNAEGEITWEKTYESMEIQWYWNPFKPFELYVQSFGQDWSFQTDYIHTESGISETIDFDQTFFQWSSKDEMVYLDWKPDEPSSTANLVKKNMQTGETQIVLENCFAFTIINGVWTTFSIEEKNGQKYVKMISKKEDTQKELFSYETLLMESFSENIQVPNFAYAPYNEGVFFYKFKEDGMTPTLFFGKGDAQLDTKQPFEGALPIVTQSDSPYVLVGYQKEWVLHTDSMKWFPMFEQ